MCAWAQASTWSTGFTLTLPLRPPCVLTLALSVQASPIRSNQTTLDNGSSAEDGCGPTANCWGRRAARAGRVRNTSTLDSYRNLALGYVLCMYSTHMITIFNREMHRAAGCVATCRLRGYMYWVFAFVHRWVATGTVYAATLYY